MKELEELREAQKALNNRKIIAFSGHLESGKDTAAEALIENGFRRVAFADALKEMAYNLNPIIGFKDGFYLRLRDVYKAGGWDLVKMHSEGRRILQVLGTECCRDIIGPDVWVDIAIRKITERLDNVVITDVRFPNEAAIVKKLGGVLIWIDRPGFHVNKAHASESGVCRKLADRILVNSGTIEELHAQVRGLAA